MTELHTLIHQCDRWLEVSAFDDYCPNGLQVEAVGEVRRVATGVTASLALVEAAAQWGADLLLVHHGYFWKNEPAPLTGVKGRRIRALLHHGISLAAYHLPLDAHPELGNNAGLARLLEIHQPAPVGERDLLWQGRLPGLSPQALSRRIARALAREPLWLPGGPARIERIAWCSGAAQGFIERAAALGCDAYVSGEVSENTFHLAAELGVHYFAAGHHATEREGVKALGQALAERFGVECRFFDEDNPV